MRPRSLVRSRFDVVSELGADDSCGESASQRLPAVTSRFAAAKAGERPGSVAWLERVRDDRRGHHLCAKALQHDVRCAAVATCLSSRVTCHTIRQSTPMHLPEDGLDACAVEPLLGHAGFAMIGWGEGGSD
ncbi:MAG: tyrosine-type recombinase/integrase [Planctomycetes bacterium]|nr:tyrosine-type recombinase/integrase [Planctomycetota bacterium]